MKRKWVILAALILSSSLASACCGQNSAIVLQASNEEVISILGELCLEANCTACLLIPIRDECTSSVPGTEMNMAKLGFGPCACGVDYSSEKFRTHDCCEYDPATGFYNKNCNQKCKNSCYSEWDSEKRNWLGNICR